MWMYICVAVGSGVFVLGRLWTPQSYTGILYNTHIHTYIHTYIALRGYILCTHIYIYLYTPLLYDIVLGNAILYVYIHYITPHLSFIHYIHPTLLLRLCRLCYKYNY